MNNIGDSLVGASIFFVFAALTLTTMGLFPLAFICAAFGIVTALIAMTCA